MNKSMLIGVVGGIALATAGGVAGYAWLGQSAQVPSEETVAMADGAAAVMPQPASNGSASAGAAVQAPVAEECWDEEVTVQNAPRDQKAIAGTAVGAILGGVLAKEIGDDKDLVTAAGAAAGAYAGRRVQKNMQANNTTTTIERRCAPAGTR